MCVTHTPVKVIDRVVPVVFYVPCKTGKAHANVAPRHLQQQQQQLQHTFHATFHNHRYLQASSQNLYIYRVSPVLTTYFKSIQRSVIPSSVPKHSAEKCPVIRTSASLATFKRSLKTFLFEQITHLAHSRQ